MTGAHVQNPLSYLYRPSLTLLTDLYQLSMMCGYLHSGIPDKEAVFYMSFRKNPFNGSFAVACGLTHVIDYIQNLRFDESDLEYLSSIPGEDGKRLFPPEFIDSLREFHFTCDVHAVPEGTLVFAHEPLIRITGPIAQCQLLETALLNIMNFQTLIATKAARLNLVSGGKPIIEFGLRRAHGPDGALAASWASYIGGCSATSNVLAGKMYGIPVKGTHAHSWVMSFDSEQDAFQEYAETLPNNCIFLVDTYDSLEGVRKAIAVGNWLRQNGHEMVGIRLDSGDLAYLSLEARKILDEGGFSHSKIVASNDLDEHIIQSLNDQGAPIDVWGVGTKLVTAYEQSALGGVYKLSAIRKAGDKEWQYKLKLSEQVAKISTPGILQVRRFWNQAVGETYFLGDMIYNQEGFADGTTADHNANVIVDPTDITRRKTFPANAAHADLLVPVFKQGKLIYNSPTATETREYVQAQLTRLHPSIKRLLNPHEYPVGLEQNLHKLKTDLIFATRKSPHAEATPGYSSNKSW